MKTYRVAFALLCSTSAFYLACSDSETSDDTVEPGADASTGKDSSTPSGEDGAITASDATTTNDSATGEDGGAGDGSSLSDGAVTDAMEAAAPVSPAMLLSISPETAIEGASFTLCATGTGVAPSARILVNGSPATPIAPDGGTADAGAPDSDAGDAGALPKTLCVSTSLATNLLGIIPIQIENAPGDLGSISNTLFVDVTPADGGLEVFDLQPDNGPVGTVVKVIGVALGSSVTLTDPQNVSVTVSPADGGGTTGWPDRPTSQYATFTVPAGWHSGPVTVTSGGKTFRARTFNVGTNLTTTAALSGTEYSGWPLGQGADNNLDTSWFTAAGVCTNDAQCSEIPIYAATFSGPKAISRISVRGNREYSDGFDFKRARIEIRGNVAPDAGAVDGGAALGALLYSHDVVLANPMRDVDLQISPPVAGASVRFVSLEDESGDPGFAEIEVFEN